MKSFEELGGFAALRKISKHFYDKVYKHEWIGKYFAEVKQETIENQQVDFMAQVLGGPQKYLGKFVPEAHSHMMITEELFALREQLLNETFIELGVEQELRDRWNKVDRAFKNKVVKNAISECQTRFATDEIMNFTNPSHSSTTTKKAA